MSAAQIADAERRDLADLLLKLGPDESTLCGDWTTRDLLAHLITRERRLDAAPGILIPPLAWWTERVQDSVAHGDFGELVGTLRSGPPFWSPLALPPLRAVDVQEFFIHHEDVRRARPGWSPRPPDEARDHQLWRMVGLLGRLTYRSSPVAVTLRRPDGAEHAVKSGPRTVILTGEPGELLLHAAGRDECVVHPEGEPADVATVMALERGL
ncbi:TIGR03085 family metal-binding protein [Actinomycetospora chibensis]|uniref:TIGR03085 family metal-binding protein n=1 Tax=Actinomycetospora chibensis TaxID=663606 RepID=A0ABV9RQF5_9PSEU|nr:TIGR03085 family metal-binding protein [Actinomycetospora chibensis]MDD7924428.1 TIGR03085 family metal-binding protein [Actinomycetospora chibensis]